MEIASVFVMARMYSALDGYLSSTLHKRMFSILNMTALALRLEWARKQMTPRPTKAALARACGVTRGAVQHWFNGGTKTLTADNYRAAAKFLGVSRNWLETGDGDPLENRPDEQAELGTFQQLEVDWNNLPEGWKYYVCHKARELRLISDGFPEWLKKTIRPIKEESSYTDWEKNLEAEMAAGMLGKFLEPRDDINQREKR